MIIRPYRFASAAGGGDPYWANVLSLLHFDGADASTTFTDETGRVWSSGNSPKITAAQGKFSQSLDVSAATNQSLYSSSLAIPVADFTVEFFTKTYADRGTAYQCLFGYSNFGIFQRSSTLMIYDSAMTTANGTVVPDLSAWHHIAWSRNSGTNRLFHDGVLLGAYNSSRTYAGPTYIASDNIGEYFQGYIDEFRFTSGVGRYTSNFTPPTAPFPNHA